MLTTAPLAFAVFIGVCDLSRPDRRLAGDGRDEDGREVGDDGWSGMWTSTTYTWSVNIYDTSESLGINIKQTMIDEMHRCMSWYHHYLYGSPDRCHC